IRAMQYSIRTEQSYVDWCHRFLAFCGETPTERLGGGGGAALPDPSGGGPVSGTPVVPDTGREAEGPLAVG
ncbi:MAG: hypothetical protein KAX51_13635, partial [Chromatiaceae bacterium]|nr:hypothetical protein [Chromatiaceae bacterium]